MSGFPRVKVLKDGVLVVAGILSRVFCSYYLSFPVTLLQFNLFKAFGLFGLWIVGITDFILKFLFIGFKCLI